MTSINHPLYLKIAGFAKNYIRIESEMVFVVLEIDKKKLYRDWGYSSLFQLLLSLGLTEHQVCSLTKVSRKCGEIPKLKEAIANKSVSVSKASRIVHVINNNDAQNWIKKASQMSNHELQKEIVAVSPKAKVKEEIKPIAFDLCRLTLSLSFEKEKKLRRLQDLYSQKLKATMTLEETLGFAIELGLVRLDPVLTAERVQNRLLTNNKKTASVQRTKLNQPDKPGPDLVHRATQRHLVHLRDKGQCQYRLPDETKCLSARFVDIHHIILRSQGGTDEATNLITLCKNHHRLTHNLLKHNFKPSLVPKAQDATIF